MKKRLSWGKRRARPTSVLLCALVVSVGLSGIVHAGGLEFPDLGTVGIGRGGAFTAKADNLSAFHYNPAGLSKSPGINVLIAFNLVNLNMAYTRGSAEGYWVGGTGGTWSTEQPESGLFAFNPGQDYSGGPEGVPFEQVNMTGFGPAPMVVVNWGDPAGIEGLSFSVGMITPSGFGSPAYPDDGAQRYMLREANLLIVFPGAGVSYRLNRYFTVGAVFLSGIGSFHQTFAFRPLPANDPYYHNEDHGGDAQLGINVTDPFVPSAVFGIMSHPLDWLELGVSVRLPAMIEAEGEVEYEAPRDDLQDSTILDDPNYVRVRQHLPLVLRTGARYIHSRFDVEFDFVWENYSSLDSYEVTMNAAIDKGIETVSLPSSEIPKNFQDSFSFRLGGDIDVLPGHLQVRLGGFYQTSAHPDNYETYTIDTPFANQVGIGGGLTWNALKWLDINVGYMHIFQEQVTVDRGIRQQLGKLATNEEGEEISIGNVSNSGTYDVNMNVMGISAEGHF